MAAPTSPAGRIGGSGHGTAPVNSVLAVSASSHSGTMSAETSRRSSSEQCAKTFRDAHMTIFSMPPAAVPLGSPSKARSFQRIA